MIALIYTLREDRKRLTNMTERVFNRELKKAFQDAIRLWHTKFAPAHFTRGAYRRYADAYKGKRKKGDGKPLVDSKALRDRVLHGSHKISGTSKGAKMRIKLGRPRRFTDKKEVHIRVLKTLYKKTPPHQYNAMSRKDRQKAYKKAENKFWSKAGYGPDAKDYFESRITAMHPQEEKFITEFIFDRMTRLVGPSGQQVTRVIQ